MDLMELVKKPSEDGTDEPYVVFTFSNFTYICPYCHTSIDTEGNGKLERACHKKEIVPQGQSWVSCNPNICPFVNGKTYHAGDENS